MRSRASIESHPLHPMLVAFPIGLWVTSLVLDLLARTTGDSSYAIAGFYTMIGGCMGAFLAALPGAIDLFTVVPPRSSGKRRGLMHGGLNTIILVLFIVIAARRGDPATMPDGLSLLLSAVGVILLGFSGWMGATLVYRNQIGVDHRYGNAGTWKQRTLESWERPACNEGELAYGQMMLIQMGNERVAIGRCSDGIVAFEDHCTHRGGPLSDGALVGCTVQCPWHGSQFDVHTGRVVAGPAQKKIMTYEVEVRAGEVYIMPKTLPEEKAA
jgi:nitrite reductase/ring-hydroxylating ferredoxin subunit/uncharacterized membrane protein